MSASISWASLLPLVPNRWARVRLQNGKTVRLLLTRDDSSMLAGFEVTRDGDRVIVHHADGSGDRLHMIQRSCIDSGEVTITPLRMNNTYAVLEVAK